MQTFVFLVHHWLPVDISNRAAENASHHVHSQIIFILFLSHCNPKVGLECLRNLDSSI